MKSVPGLGTVPSQWIVERSKWLLDRKRRDVRPDDGIVTAFRDGQVTLRENRRTEGFTNAIQEIGYQGLREGDLVVHGMDGFAGAIGVSDSDGKSSPVVHAYRSNGRVDVRYVAYVLRTLARNEYVVTLAKGIRERSTAFDSATLANVQLPVPPLEEQRRIADFLDAETTRIDKLVQLAERAQNLANWRRGAVVDHEFASWDTVPITSVCRRIVDCVNKTAPLVADETPYRMIRTSNVRQGKVDVDDTYRVSEDTFRRWNRRGAPVPGDILFTRQAPVGEAGILRSNSPVFLGQQVMLYRADEEKILPELLLYNFLSSSMKRQFGLASDGAAHAHMRVHECLKLKVVVPQGFLEQKRVAKEIQRGMEFSDRLESTVVRQVQILKERRQALITAAVTGEFDVSAASGRGIEE